MAVARRSLSRLEEFVCGVRQGSSVTSFLWVTDSLISPAAVTRTTTLSSRIQRRHLCHELGLLPFPCVKSTLSEGFSVSLVFQTPTHASVGGPPTPASC